MFQRYVAALLLGVLLLGGGLGCGSSGIKGTEKDKDMPKPMEKEG